MMNTEFSIIEKKQVYKVKRNVFFKKINDPTLPIDKATLNKLNSFQNRDCCPSILLIKALPEFNLYNLAGYSVDVPIASVINNYGSDFIMRRLYPCDAIQLKVALSPTTMPQTISEIKTICDDVLKTQDFLSEGFTLDWANEITYTQLDYQNNTIVIQYAVSSVNKHIISDEEDKTKKTKDDLFALAYFDSITGFHNWNWLWNKIDVMTAEGCPEYGFAQFDIKDFKMINEIYNHQVANECLCRVCEELQRSESWIYHAARCDNDNFAIILKPMSEQETKEKLEHFFDNISKLYCDESYSIFYRCGVVCSEHAVPHRDMVADLAKMAQRLGQKHNKTEIHFYTEQMHNDILWGNKLKAHLDKAINDDEFIVYLQPKYDINTEKIVGSEALVRWNLNHDTFLTPNRFIPFLEKDESVGKVDQFVLEKVCSELARWKKEGLPLYPISVNLSRSELGSQNLVERLSRIVASYGIDFSLIDFELTESAAYDDQEYMINTLKELSAKGFQLSIDDFGTGYSSLSLLKDMPLNTLKIDKSFVDALLVPLKDNREQLIIRDIINLTKSLRIKCLAEGAETLEQIEKLREWGCGTIQGYYYSKPIPINEYESKIKAQM